MYFVDTLLSFSTHIYNMEAKSSNQRRAFFYVYLPIVRAKWPEVDSKFELFITKL